MDTRIQDRLRICGCRNIIWVGGYVDTRRAYERYEKTYNWGYTYMYINTGIGGYADTGYHRGYGVAGILYGYADTWIRGKLMRCMRRHTYGGIYEYRYWWIRGYAIRPKIWVVGICGFVDTRIRETSVMGNIVVHGEFFERQKETRNIV